MNLMGKTKCLTCPKCGEVILQIDGKDKVLKNRIVIFRDHGTIAKCKQCKCEVNVCKGNVKTRCCDRSTDKMVIGDTSLWDVSPITIAPENQSINRVSNKRH